MNLLVATSTVAGNLDRGIGDDVGTEGRDCRVAFHGDISNVLLGLSDECMVP